MGLSHLIRKGPSAGTRGHYIVARERWRLWSHYKGGPWNAETCRISKKLRGSGEETRELSPQLASITFHRIKIKGKLRTTDFSSLGLFIILWWASDWKTQHLSAKNTINLSKFNEKAAYEIKILKLTTEEKYIWEEKYNIETTQNT